jgi:hypothetical protein
MIKFLSLAFYIYDFTRGTIWKFRENKWKNQLVDKNGESGEFSWNLVLSIRRKQPVSLFELVPILHGVSEDISGVVVKDLTPNSTEQNTAVFRNIGPSPFPVSCLHKSAELEGTEKPFDSILYHDDLSKNRWKPKLNDNELASLFTFLKKRGLE